MLQPDLCVIGAGSGGLSVAAAAARLGADVVLIEAHRMGGDCLNYGCVPSKALIAAARQAHTLRSGARFGVSNRRPQVSMRDVRDHIRDVIAEIAPNDSVERFTGLGVRVIQAQARFTDRATVVAGEQEIRARRFVVATGSSPAVPPVDGLDAVPYLTNETVFELSELPSRLVVLGGGAIGMELAQAYRRLGSQVVVLEAATPLGRDDPELARFVLDQVEAEGVQVHCGVRVLAVAQEDDRIAVTFAGGDGEQRVQASHILVAAGRKPNVDGLGLEAAGIRYSPTGIEVNRSLRTSNRRVYAIGDVIGQHQFTHVAGYHAGLVVRNTLFRLPARVNPDIIPWVTFTDPELAHVGLTEAEARRRHGGVRVMRWPYAENDRARTERRTGGMVKVVTGRRGTVLGASVVGQHAGEVIQPWCLAISAGLNISAMARVVLPYPTWGEINRRAALEYYTTLAQRSWVRRTIGVLARFG